MLDFIMRYWLQELMVLVLSLVSYLVKLFIKNRKMVHLNKKAIILLLKNNIIEEFDKLKNKDKISIADKEKLIELYNLYDEFECCSIVSDLMKELDSIPIK